MRMDVFHPAGLSPGLTTLPRAMPCPASPDAVSQAPTAAAVPAAMPVVPVWQAAGPSKGGRLLRV